MTFGGSAMPPCTSLSMMIWYRVQSNYGFDCRNRVLLPGNYAFAK